jgi:very-short-patch-repair endonuclease
MAKGWRIHGQIGVSGYRIDLGVVHPDSSGKYLAGVECDGATYHSSATARDRDKLREQVLRGLGWEILRVWSTDWWFDSQSCLENLDKALRLALEKDRNATEELKKAASYKDTDNTDDPAGLAEDAAEFLYDTHEVTAPERTAESAPVYRVSNPQEAVGALNPDAFYDVCERSNIVAMIAHVVKNEGPISLDLLAEHIARAYGFKRTGNRILKLIKKMVQHQYHSHTENGQIFIWPEGCLPQDYCEFRVSPLGAEPARKVEQICIAELSALAKYIAETLYPVDDNQHMKAIADKLGFKRVTEKMAKRLRLVLGQFEKQKPD